MAIRAILMILQLLKNKNDQSLELNQLFSIVNSN